MSHSNSQVLSVCRLLFLKLKAQNEREKFAFCSMKGCERIKIKALIPRNAGISDCTATAYPRFTERATVDVPMPRKLFGAQLVSGHGRQGLLPPVGSDPAELLSGYLLSSLTQFWVKAQGT